MVASTSMAKKKEEWRQILDSSKVEPKGLLMDLRGI